MCRATVGATPVNSCTFAASSSFSCGVRGTPCWANTLKRVPEFPYAHDGVSTAWVLRADFTAASSVIGAPLYESIQSAKLWATRRGVKGYCTPLIPCPDRDLWLSKLFRGGPIDVTCAARLTSRQPS